MLAAMYAVTESVRSAVVISVSLGVRWVTHIMRAIHYFCQRPHQNDKGWCRNRRIFVLASRPSSYELELMVLVATTRPNMIKKIIM